MCKYCCRDSEIMEGETRTILGQPFSTGVYIAEYQNVLRVEFGDDQIFEKSIKFCPMCGQDLNYRGNDE